MRASDWIKVLTNLGPYIIPVVWIVMWSLESIFSRDGQQSERQTELLERIAAKLDKTTS